MGLRNKRGWIQIVEAFLAIILLLAVVLIVVAKEKQLVDVSPQIHDSEIATLRTVELNDSARNEILATGGTVLWTDFPLKVPKTKSIIDESTPASLQCAAQICNPSDSCILNTGQSGDVYAESEIITANSGVYNPRLLKIFCWAK